MGTPSPDALAWAASGLMSLTGPPGPAVYAPPEGLVDRVRSLDAGLRIDPLPLLAERAACAGLTRRGATSCGGTARLLRAHDDWVVVNLPREDDRTLVPAWLQPEGEVTDPWEVVEAVVPTRRAADIVERATLLGLPCARLGECGPVEPERRLGTLPVAAATFGSERGRDPRSVLDLSSLWAGPLCGRLLAERGAAVTKVEATRRPDGARWGSRAFFDVLNGCKRSVALDLRTRRGIEELRALVHHVDVVIESSRPRALRQMGIVAEEILASGTGPSIWVSITGYGRRHERVAFGDDAAVAGGLVASGEHGGPWFVGDAIADPLAGVTAAAAVVECARAGGRWLVDVSMSAVAAFVAGPDREIRWRACDVDAPAPRAPQPSERAPTLGRDTSAVVSAVLLSPR